jgi:hypothetical protein
MKEKDLGIRPTLASKRKLHFLFNILILNVVPAQYQDE